MKRALVTGGSGLIGNVVCHQLKDAGWDVANFDLSSGDASIRHILCDISDETSVHQAFEKLGWDSLDLLVNNGGNTQNALHHDIETTDLKTWNTILQSHLTGAFLMSRSALPLLKNGSSIVMLASTRALMSEGHDFAYAAAKGGIISLTQALAIQLGPKIRVNGIAAGWITNETDLRDADHKQHPAGRVGHPRDIADAIIYLSNAEFITGQTLTVDGGITKKMLYIP